MKSIVRYEKRGNGGKTSYRGNCSPRLIQDLNNFFKFKGLSDYMVGSGTTIDALSDKDVVVNGYDLNNGFDLINDEIPERNDNIFWHPPYWDIIKYSGYMYGEKNIANPSDISHIPDYKDFMNITNSLLMKQFASLRVGGRMIVLFGDIKKKGKLYSMLVDIVKPGTLEQIIIKEQYNTVSERRKYTGKFIPIIHEYVMILRKDNPYIGSMKITKEIAFDVRDSIQASWKDVIASVFEANGNKYLSLKFIYGELKDHRKAQNNNHVDAKIRQVLNGYDIFKKIDKGVYALAQ